MNWNKLLHNGRIKDKQKESFEAFPEFGMIEENYREELERDYDRILFLAPTRRLADKTQVFPLEQNDSVRTRLTHSYEVSNLCRSIGTDLAHKHESLFPDHNLHKRNANLTRSLPSLLAAIGLAHDLGNPPFGHQGESAIQSWFKSKIKTNKIFQESKENPIYQDFTSFDGNAQTVRLLTKLQVLNDNFGVNLTYATLAAMLKYPQSNEYISNITDTAPRWKKHGFFYSEQQLVNDIWTETGLREGQRHPLTYIMEACDDIAYSVLDAEDIIKKGLASFHDLINHLSHYMECGKKKLEDDLSKKRITQEDYSVGEEKLSIIQHVIDLSMRKHKEFSKPDLNLTPCELNDISMQMFRVFAIGSLISEVTQTFVSKSCQLCTYDNPPKDLMSMSNGSYLCIALKEFDFKWGYKNKSVLKLELEGYNYIQELMDMLWIGISGKLSTDDPKESNTPFGKYVYGRISENYRRVFEDRNNTLPEDYKEAQLLTDAISGMTDNYLISLHKELKKLYRQN